MFLFKTAMIQNVKWNVHLFDQPLAAGVPVPEDAYHTNGLW